MGESEVLIGAQRLAEIVGGRIRPAGVVNVVEKALAPDVVVEGEVRVAGITGEAPPLVDGQRDTEEYREVPGNRALQMIHLVARRRIGVRPEHEAGGGVGEVDHMLQPAPPLHDLAVDHGANPESLAERGRAGGGLPRLDSAHDLQPFDLTQLIDEAGADPVGEVVELGIAGEIGKGKNRQRSQLCGRPSVGSADEIRRGRERDRHRGRCREADPHLRGAMRRPRYGRGGAGGSLAAAESRFEPLELALEVARGLKAILGVLFQTPTDSAAELGRQLYLHLTDLGWLMAQDRGDDLGRAGGRKGVFAGGQCVENGADGKDVGPLIDLPAFELLGRHVGRGAENFAFRGQELGLDERDCVLPG